MLKLTQYHLKFVSTGFFVLFLFTLVSSQTRSNPFEIKPRLKTLNITDTFTPVKLNLKGQGRESLNNEESNSSEKSIQNSNINENPFDIDHVPLRKSNIIKSSEYLNRPSIGSRSSNNFLFWFLLLSSGILAIVLNTKSKAISLIYRSLINENMLKLFYREESVKVSTYLFLLYFVFCINTAVYIYLISLYYGGPSGINTFFLILAGVFAVYIVRHLSLSVLGIVFKISKNTSLYGFTIMVFNHFAGLFLLPLNLLIAFGPESVKEIIIGISFLIILILVFLRTVRGIFIVSEYLIDRLFQIFIYLCAFEIAPILILIKTVMNSGQ